MSGDDARDMEPDLSPAVNGAVILTETGILDRGDLIHSLEREVEEEEYLSGSGSTGVGSKRGVGRRGAGKGDKRGEGVIVRGTRVVRIDPGEKGGWVVQLESGWNGDVGSKGEVEAVRAEVVINAAGWEGAGLLNGVIPEEERTVSQAVEGWSCSISLEPRPIADGTGRYLSYSGPGVENVSRIIHPCPGRYTDGVSGRLVSLPPRCKPRFLADFGRV